MWRICTVQFCAHFPNSPHTRGFAHGVFAAWLLLGCCVQCCPLKKTLRAGHVRVYLSPAQPLPTPWRGFFGGFRGRTVSSMVWGIEHSLVLRSPFTADRFYHPYGYNLSDGHVVMSVQQMCVKTKFCVFGALEVFHVLLAALCVWGHDLALPLAL